MGDKALFSLLTAATGGRRMCPLYVVGLIGPGERKSIQPTADRLALGDYDQPHHFVAAGVWDAAPLETELLVTCHSAPLGPRCYLCAASYQQTLGCGK